MTGIEEKRARDSYRSILEVVIFNRIPTVWSEVRANFRCYAGAGVITLTSAEVDMNVVVLTAADVAIHTFAV